MRQKRIIMGMPVGVEIRDQEVIPGIFDEVFSYFTYVDQKFSTYKTTSEISAINRGEIPKEKWSADMKEVISLSEKTRKETGGYFDIVTPKGFIDPSGMVKGWAIWKASEIIKSKDIKNFYVEIGGDIQVSGRNAQGGVWSVGIENPLWTKEEVGMGVVKIIYLDDKGVATSGTYKRGTHIYDPVKKASPSDGILSLTVIGPNVYEADRFATAAFAMGTRGIEFLEKLPGFEAYQIDKDGQVVMTSGFENYMKEK
ncbi:MAG: FAD:protein FMN transferase [Candidatus Pacebacteria bacterium]|nr:FAD:protein FMN transferase [Candidatus Paceibacterota bacterium]MDD5357055.1 FAD:protein FMN transferase [Candidatus Paceibacterota bacterium]